MTANPAFAIVLLNYNNVHFLRQNLFYLSRLTYSNCVIYVVDNCSTDDSIEFVRNEFPSVQVICLDKNYGYAGGYNSSLKGISADYYCLLNTDVEVTPDFLDPVLKLMETQPSIGICQPKILSIQNRDHFEYAGGSGGWIDLLGYTFVRGRMLDHLERDTGQYDKPAKVFWASGACFIIKASLFHLLGGFDDRFFMYSEEVDLCWRAQLAGYDSYVCPQSTVFHRETTKLPDQSPRRIYLVFRNNLVMLHQNLPLRSRLILLPFRFILNGIAAAVFLCQGQVLKTFKILQAHISYLKWLISQSPKKAVRKKPLRDLNGVYRGSILLDYYIRRKRTFKSIIKDDAA